MAQLELSQSESNLKRAYRKAFKHDKMRYQIEKVSTLKDASFEKQFTATVQPILYKVATLICALLSAYIVVCEILIMFQLQI